MCPVFWYLTIIPPISAFTAKIAHHSIYSSLDSVLVSGWLSMAHATSYDDNDVNNFALFFFLIFYVVGLTGDGLQVQKSISLP